MNKINISTDGVCVFVHSKIQAGLAPRIIFGTGVLSSITGLVVLMTDENSPLGLILFLGGLVFTLPFLRSIFWNIFGEESISISTKSIWCQYSYGFFNSNPRVYTYDGRLRFGFEVIREDNGMKEGEAHFFTYDNCNQPCHLFKTTIYMTEADYENLIAKIQLVFALDKEISYESLLN